MPAKGYGSTKARVIRLTRLDACGRIVGGDCAYLVSGGFVQVGAAAEYEEGDEFVQKTAWGDFCINEKDDDRLKRMNLTIDFCQVHPDVADIAAGQDIIVDATGNPIGWRVGEMMSDAEFALEVWTKVAASSDACAPGAGAGSGQPWHYWLFPRVKVGTIGDLTFEYGPMTFQITASTLPATDGWQSSPYVPTPAPAGVVVEQGDHWLYVQSTTPPPVETDGCQLMQVANVPVSSVVAGTPGAFVPSFASPPADLAALKADAAVGTTAMAGATAWTAGEYVTLDDSSQAFWDGTEWMVGAAPDPFDLSGTYPDASQLADLATLKADGTSGDAGSGSPFNGGTGTDVGFASGEFIMLGDASQAHWDGAAWTAGAAV